jgi:hypothetical protein
VFHDQIWVHALARKAEQYKNVVIPDVRFPNEIDYIKDAGGFVIRVVRGKEPKWYEAAMKANKTGDLNDILKTGVHFSEWAWIGNLYNYVITNNGSLIMLESDVKHMLKVFTGSAIMNEVE